MILTKYGHACFTIEKVGRLLVVDPGAYTEDIGAPENVVGIIVTHEHADHFDVNALGALIGHNPDALIFAPESVTTQLGDTLPNKTVAPDDEVSVGPFSLTFYGGEHAEIHASLPPITNIGVMIDEKVYYPGDSFVLPHKPVDVLALPVAAPWLKLSDTIDFLAEIKPRLIFPTHDAVLSDIGKSLPDKMLPAIAEKNGATYQRLHEPIEI